MSRTTIWWMVGIATGMVFGSLEYSGWIGVAKIFAVPAVGAAIGCILEILFHGGLSR